MITHKKLALFLSAAALLLWIVPNVWPAGAKNIRPQRGQTTVQGGSHTRRSSDSRNRIYPRGETEKERQERLRKWAEKDRIREKQGADREAERLRFKQAMAERKQKNEKNTKSPMEKRITALEREVYRLRELVPLLEERIISLEKLVWKKTEKIKF